MTSILADQDQRRRAALLLAVAISSVALWQVPIGGFLLYPFTILATWFHEMGHGLTAMLLGSEFDRLEIFSDGSGLAHTLRPADSYRITSAMVSAGGPLGPAIAGSLLIVASRTPRATSTALTVLGVALVLSTLIWVRSLTGWLVLPALGLAILTLAGRGTPAHQRLGIQVLGVQACISVWRQFDYLFSSGGSIGGRMHRSDTGAIADALLLPYWVWGGIISVTVVAMLCYSLKVAFRRR